MSRYSDMCCFLCSVLGHEAVVEVVHSRRDGLKPGDCITFSVIDCCKECDRCSRGLEQKCRKLFKVYGPL